METRQHVRSKVLTYLILTFALSSIFYYRIIHAGTLRGGGNVFLLMWCPGTAGLLTQLLFERSVGGLGWGWGKTRYQFWSYFTPLVYSLAAYVIIWAAGFGGFFNRGFVEKAAARFGMHSAWATIGVLFVTAATLGVAESCMSALGEEIGWRGVLIPNVAKLTGYTKTCLITGAIWSVWHYPVLLFADYNGGTPVWYSLSCFTVLVLSISFVFTWLRLKSGSLWTGMLLHASHNLFVQAVFTPLTVDTGRTRYFIDEFGLVLPLTAAMAAYIFWRKRGELAADGTIQAA